MTWLSRLFDRKPKQEEKPPPASELSVEELVKKLEEEKLILVDGVGIDWQDSDGKIVYSFHRDLVNPDAPPEVQRELLKQVRGMVDRMYLSSMRKGLFKTYAPDDDGGIEITDETRMPLQAPFVNYIIELGEFHLADKAESLKEIIGDKEPDRGFEILLGLEWYVNDVILNLYDNHFMNIPYEPEEEALLTGRALTAIKEIPRDVLEVILHNKIPLRYQAEQKLVSKAGSQFAGTFHDYVNFIFFCDGIGTEGEDLKELKGPQLIKYNERVGFERFISTAIHEAGHAIFNWDQSDNTCRMQITKNDYKKLWAGIEKLRERVARIEAGDETLAVEAHPIIGGQTEEQKRGFVPWLQAMIYKYDGIGTKAYDDHRKHYGENLAVEYLVDWFAIMQSKNFKGIYRPYAEFICPEMCQLVDTLITQKAAQDLLEIRKKQAEGIVEEPLFDETKRNRVRDMVVKLNTPKILGHTDVLQDKKELPPGENISP